MKNIEECSRIEDLFFDPKYITDSLSCIDNRGTWNLARIQEGILWLEKSLQITPGQIVAVICENSVSLIIAVISVLKAGGTVLLIDPQLPFITIEQLMNDANAKTVCLYGEKPESLTFDESIRTLREGKGEWHQQATSLASEYNRQSVKNAIILPTSGTTGRSKLVVLSHSAILTNLRSILSYMDCTSLDTFLIVKSMIHSSTITGEILPAIVAGAKTVILNPIVPIRSILKRIYDYKVSIMGVNPTLLRLMCHTHFDSNKLSSLRLIYTSGAIANNSVLKQAESYFKTASVCNVYGLTEAGPRVSAQTIKMPKKYGSVGVPIQGVHVQILDSKGNLCKTGHMGEIVVKTPSMMSGYLNDPIATNQKIRAGLIYTGDTGFIDDSGELFVLGRSDDVIIVNGKNVNPASIENIIESIYEGVECIVFGVPDESLGERIICIIKSSILKPMHKKELIMSCRRHLAKHECPHEVFFWDEIPKNTFGKVSRQYVKELFRERYAKDQV